MSHAHASLSKQKVTFFFVLWRAALDQLGRKNYCQQPEKERGIMSLLGLQDVSIFMHKFKLVILVHMSLTFQKHIFNL